jgi:hypothetical protein
MPLGLSRVDLHPRQVHCCYVIDCDPSGLTAAVLGGLDIGTLHCALILIGGSTVVHSATLGGSTSPHLCVWELIAMIFDSVIMIFESVIKMFDSIVMIFGSVIKMFDSIAMIFGSVIKMFDSIAMIFDSVIMTFEPSIKIFDSIVMTFESSIKNLRLR